MPTAGPSRRNKTSSSRQNGRSRRDADEDAIEEDPSQEQQNDDVDEEDEDGPHIRRRGTASNNVQQRRKGSLTANIIKSENGATDEAEVEEEEQRIDIENFEDQPLSRQDGNTIMRFGNEWEQMKAKARTGGIESISDVAAALADGGGDQAEGVCLSFSKTQRITLT
jgi:E3 SUMO-protein ligase NSE2